MRLQQVPLGLADPAADGGELHGTVHAAAVGEGLGIWQITPQRRVPRTIQ